jgi:trans-2-enoyl-CoA reductase
MNHLQLHQAALPDLSANQISRLPKDQLAQFSHAVQELHDLTIQMRGRINRGLEQRYDEQIRQANSFGEEESARLRIDDVDLQIDVSQPKEIVWDQEHLIR